jgi:single-strand DNA-binding protein
MSDVNTVVVSGTIAQEVELRFTPTGVKTTNLRLAIHRRYKTKAGEVKEETEFITVVVWNEAAENCAKYLKKGSKVLVEGRLQTREFVDKEQQKRTVTEIKANMVEFLDRPEKKEE